MGEFEQESFSGKVVGQGSRVRSDRAFGKVLGFAMHVLEGEECLC